MRSALMLVGFVLLMLLLGWTGEQDRLDAAALRTGALLSHGAALYEAHCELELARR